MISESYLLDVSCLHICHLYIDTASLLVLFLTLFLLLCLRLVAVLLFSCLFDLCPYPGSRFVFLLLFLLLTPGRWPDGPTINMFSSHKLEVVPQKVVEASNLAPDGDA